MSIETWIDTNVGAEVGRDLRRMLRSKVGRGVNGFLYFEDDSFEVFKKIPHLFQNGERFLSTLRAVETLLQGETKLLADERNNLLAVCSLLRTLVLSANITAPSDLWLVREVLSSYAALGLIDQMRSFQLSEFAFKHNLNDRLFRLDCELLLNRGYFEKKSGQFIGWSPLYGASEQIAAMTPFPPSWPHNWIPRVRNGLHGMRDAMTKDWLGQLKVKRSETEARAGWVADWRETQLGHRIVPILLAIRTSSFYDEIIRTAHLGDRVLRSEVGPDVCEALLAAGYVLQDGSLTELGKRVFLRGPGPFGIIHAYYPYMEKHLDLLTKNEVHAWISRSENVAASQEANAKAFAGGLAGLERFQRETGFTFSVFIEHAVGKGEATRQFFSEHGEEHYQYFGFDLEEKAIEQTKNEKDAARLPKNMRLQAGTDIGKPNLVIGAVTAAGFDTREAVMVVGNGFHEVRNQTDALMTQVFRQYCEAGILLIFTEETGLSAEQIVGAAWNTYHAGFHYLHELSGQGLRAFSGHREPPRTLTWKECAEAGGYKVLAEYCAFGRTVFPRAPATDNPAINVTYFCVPANVRFDSN